MIGYHGGTATTIKGRVWVAMDRAYAEMHGERHADGAGYIVHEVPLDGLSVLDLSDQEPDSFVREEIAELLVEAGVDEDVAATLIDDADADCLWWTLDTRDYLTDAILAAGYDAVRIRESYSTTRVGEAGVAYETMLILNLVP